MVLVSFFCNVPFFKIITVASYTVKNGLPYNFECLFVLAKNQLVVSTAFLIAIAMNIMSTPASIPHQSYTKVVFIATNHKSMYRVGSYVIITSSSSSYTCTDCKKSLVIYLSLSQLFLTDLSHGLCKFKAIGDASYM